MNKLEKLTIFILIIAITVVAIMVIMDNRSEVIINEFEVPSRDAAAIAGAPDNVDEELRYNEIAVSETFKVFICVDPVVEEDSAIVYFTMAAENTVSTKLQIFDSEGNLLGESGLIMPGEYVEKIRLYSVPDETEFAVAKILSYEQGSYYSKGTATVQMLLHIE